MNKCVVLNKYEKSFVRLSWTAINTTAIAAVECLIPEMSRLKYLQRNIISVSSSSFYKSIDAQSFYLLFFFFCRLLAHVFYK